MRIILALAAILFITGCSSSEESTPEPQAATSDGSGTQEQTLTPPLEFNVTGFVHEVEELFQANPDDYIQITRDQDGKSSPFYQEGTTLEIKAYKFYMPTDNPMVVGLSLGNASTDNAANQSLAVGLSSRLIDPKRHHYVFQSGSTVGHLSLSCDYPFERFEELQARLLNALREPVMNREEVFPCQ